MGTLPPIPDREGYTADAPTGLSIQLTYWDDLNTHWVERRDVTELVFQGVEQDQRRDPRYDPDKDAFFSGMGLVLKRLLDINYEAQVTGANYDKIYWEVRQQVHDAIADKLSGIADVDGVFDYSLNLTTSGEYFAELASRPTAASPTSLAEVPAGFVTFVRDPDAGDVLLLKYVTHGNYVKFSLALNFGGQVVEQALNPFSVFTGPPSFTVTFDTVTRIAVQLPHRSPQGIRVLSATLQNVGADVHSENADAWLVKAVNSFVRFFGASGFFVPVQRAFDALQIDLKGSIQGPLQRVNQLLTGKAKFDQADYHIDWGDEWNPATVVMNFTVNPWRQFRVTIDQIQENFHSDPHAGTVSTFAKVRIGDNTTLDTYEGNPLYRLYQDGTRLVTIHVEIWRHTLPRVIHGQLQKENGSWYVHYEDGTTIDLGPGFDPSEMPPGGPAIVVQPPVPSGLARAFNLRVDYATRTITGFVDRVPISGKDGQSIYIPGNPSNVTGSRQTTQQAHILGDPSSPGDWRATRQQAHTVDEPPKPDVWLTISMEGTRTLELP